METQRKKRNKTGKRGEIRRLQMLDHMARCEVMVSTTCVYAAATAAAIFMSVRCHAYRTGQDRGPFRYKTRQL